MALRAMEGQMGLEEVVDHCFLGFELKAMLGRYVFANVVGGEIGELVADSEGLGVEVSGQVASDHLFNVENFEFGGDQSTDMLGGLA